MTANIQDIHVISHQKAPIPHSTSRLYFLAMLPILCLKLAWCTHATAWHACLCRGSRCSNLPLSIYLIPSRRCLFSHAALPLWAGGLGGGCCSQGRAPLEGSFQGVPMPPHQLCLSQTDHPLRFLSALTYGMSFDSGHLWPAAADDTVTLP